MSVYKKFTCLADFVEYCGPLPRVLFVGGKGGVGKTTSAASLALGYSGYSGYSSLPQISKTSQAGQSQTQDKAKCLLVSLDPAHSLCDVLDTTPQRGEKPFVLCEGLDVLELDPEAVATAYLRRVQHNVAQFLSPKLLQRMQKQLQLAASAPGTVEAALTEKIAQLICSTQYAHYSHIIFDTAPTGHTLQLLHMPEIFSGWVQGLISGRERAQKLDQVARSLSGSGAKHERRENGEAIAGNLSGLNGSGQSDKLGEASSVSEQREQKVQAVLNERHKLLQCLTRVLQDGTQCAFLLVLNAESLPLAETLRTYKALRSMKIRVAGLVVNRVLPHLESVSGEIGDFYRAQHQREQQYLEEIEGHFAKTLPRIYQSYSTAQLQGSDALLQNFCGEGIR